MKTGGRVGNRLYDEMLARAKELGFDNLDECVRYLNDLDLSPCGNRTPQCEPCTVQTPGGPPAPGSSLVGGVPVASSPDSVKGTFLTHEERTVLALRFGLELISLEEVNERGA